MTNRLKQLRKEKGLTLDEIQNKTGITRGTYNNYENGVTEPKLETWQKLADFFGVSVPYLQGISRVRSPKAYRDYETFLNTLYSQREESDYVPINEFVAFHAVNERETFNQLVNLVTNALGNSDFKQRFTKAIKSVPYDADFKTLSSVNTATLEVFLLGIQAMQGKKEALDAYKEINKILDNRLKR